MRNKSDTVTVSVRLPEDLIEKIDESISARNMYWNRADLILYTVREYYGMITTLVYGNLVEKYEKVKPSKEELDAEFYVMLEKQLKPIIETGNKIYAKYDGSMKQILIRMPYGLFWHLNVWFNENIGLQNFIRYVVALFLTNPVNVTISPLEPGKQMGMIMRGRPWFGNIKIKLDD
jgi:metal-responsive CopG/Arc/MetJ family transcriptional regulator